ncbi:unnamed protein product, partial [Prorocentrum cordatum]
ARFGSFSMATIEGTARLLRRAVERGALHPANVRALGDSRLSCAALGFGAYRVGGGDETAHHGALSAALRAGVNLVDTSSHYSAGGGKPGGGHGASERLVRRVLADAAEAGQVCREGVVICTKLGHVERGAEPPPESVVIAQQGDVHGEDWHSIDPGFVEAEVRASGERLGTPPDFVLLHNPEYFLSAQLVKRVPIADAWDEMYDRLERAFGALEALCDEGAIGHGYGVSGNFLSCLFSTTGRPNLYEALALDRVVDAAARAARRRGGSGHRLRLAQLPLNVFESGAVLGRGAAVPEAAGGDCAAAAGLKVALMSNRPLNALPMPGVSAGDWGRSASHLRLRDARPMGAVESLLRRVLSEALAEGGGGDALPLQQLSLRLSLSAPSVACCLNGMHDARYVQDAAAVLQAAPFSAEQTVRALQAARSAAEELGCERRGLW